MGKDFKSYINNNPDLNKKPEKNKKADKQTAEQTAENITKQYEGKSKEELTDEILDRVNKGKKDGSVNITELENMSRMVAPMLNSDQQKRLQEIMKLIKEQ